MLCNPCHTEKKLKRLADFHTKFQNIIIPMCTDHAWVILNKGGEITPMPGTKDKGVTE